LPLALSIQERALGFYKSAMDYELVKKLKSAGFPQGFYPHEERHHSWLDADGHYSSCQAGPSSCYIPTLSELIDLCGDRPFTLGHLSKGVDWVARGGNYPHFFTGIGHTPEVAVANLWLEMNKQGALAQLS
jgi:hypothetical protein